MKYRKKPIVIEAIRWNGINLSEIISFVGNSLSYYLCDTVREAGAERSIVRMAIRTLNGDRKCTVGDYIIRGVAGEFYLCKPDIFEATYEKVED